MSRYKLEVMLSEELLARLDEARKFEPRASFARRALEAALGGDSAPGTLASAKAEPSAAARPQTPAPPRVHAEQSEVVLPKTAKRKW
jgi:hypothetical protein